MIQLGQLQKDNLKLETNLIGIHIFIKFYVNLLLSHYLLASQPSKALLPPLYMNPNWKDYFLKMAFFNRSSFIILYIIVFVCKLLFSSFSLFLPWLEIYLDSIRKRTFFYLLFYWNSSGEKNGSKLLYLSPVLNGPVQVLLLFFKKKKN